jgi:uncharacterized protein
MRVSRGLLCWTTAAVAVWLALAVAIGIVMADVALHPARRPIAPQDKLSAQAVSGRNHAVLSDVAIAAPDGVVLRAWEMMPQDWNEDAVILLHGQGDNRAGMLGVADLLLRHRYAVLLPDARAQGASDGAIATYGVVEAGDLRRWYEWLQESQHPLCVDGLGESMGAAIVLEASAAVPEFCAVVAESAFSSFREAGYLRLGQQFGAGPWLGRTLLFPAVEAGFLYAQLHYGVSLERASPLKAVESTQVPILLIHGLADTNLPPSFSEEMKARHPSAMLWEPAGAGHCGAMQAEPREYEQLVVGWLASHARSNAASLSK